MNNQTDRRLTLSFLKEKLSDSLSPREIERTITTLQEKGILIVDGEDISLTDLGMNIVMIYDDSSVPTETEGFN